MLPALRTAATAVGVDFSREQLRRAVDNAPAASLVQGDMAELPISDGVFDAVTAYHSVIHLPTAQHQATRGLSHRRLNCQKYRSESN